MAATPFTTILDTARARQAAVAIEACVGRISEA